MSDHQVSVMDQCVPAGSSAENASRTPLSHVTSELHGSAGQMTGQKIDQKVGLAASSSASLQEAPLCGLLILRATDYAQTLSNALNESLSLPLPERLQSTVSADYCVRWMSPDAWLLSCPLSETFHLETSLRERVSGSIAVVNVSGGYAVMKLSGADARTILKKSTAYNVEERNFPPGKVVNTLLAKAQVILRHVEPEHFELIVRRSYADYLWLWLQRAGREVGLHAQKAL